ncbi:MAG: OadG family protein [Clostridia bacterium]|nr:OadG family protein [Clostridia bacterium]
MEQMTLLGKLGLGLQTTLMGMAVTFVGLAILQGVMLMMAKMSNGKHGTARAGAGGSQDDGEDEEESHTGEETDLAPEPEPDAIAAPAADHAGQPSARAEEEIAAIAAVMAIITGEQTRPDAAGASARAYPAQANLWGLAGRRDNMAGRQRAMRQ